MRIIKVATKSRPGLVAGAIAQGEGAAAAGAGGVAVSGDVGGDIIVTGDKSTVGEKDSEVR